jgi:XRE family transcriptional regulator, regulator of sulfur utilization
MAMTTDDVGTRLGKNVRQLREARGLTQARIAELAGLPRATWANLESGASNPTLAVLDRVAAAFQVSLEELVAMPRSETRHYPKSTLPERTRGNVLVRKLLPDPIPGMELDRFWLPPRARMTGVPHTAGTREYLTCERGSLVLLASGERFELLPGDVVAFRGDQRHSYENPGRETAVAYSVVVLAR